MSKNADVKSYPCGCQTQQVGKILFYAPCSLDHCEAMDVVLEEGKKGLEIRWRKLG
jgi:hypothetical protein